MLFLLPSLLLATPAFAVDVLLVVFDQCARRPVQKPESACRETRGGRGLGMNLDRAEVSRRQLGTALSLFLDDQDAVSVHTLACAGSEIAEHLMRIADQKPFSTHALQSIPDLDMVSPHVRTFIAAEHPSQLR
jgi:hypothetical protein